jgi:hypothetical protein
MLAMLAFIASCAFKTVLQKIIIKPFTFHFDTLKETPALLRQKIGTVIDHPPAK